MRETVTDAVADVLRRAVLDGTRLTLPPEQLDRKLYVAVNDALVRIGGTWDRKAKAHVFSTDPTARLAEMLNGGALPEKNPLAYFPTPLDVIERMLSMLDGGVTGTILEPSAGEGAIVRALLERGDPTAIVHAAELDPDRYRTLASLASTSVRPWHGDFLQFESPTRFDAVVMNPPFAVAGDALAYVPHIERAFAMLRPGGQLVAVAPSGVLSRDNKRVREFREFVERHGYIESLPPAAFKESGTGVNAVLIYVRASVAQERAA